MQATDGTENDGGAELGRGREVEREERGAEHECTVIPRPSGAESRRERRAA